MSARRNLALAVSGLAGAVALFALRLVAITPATACGSPGEAPAAAPGLFLGLLVMALAVATLPASAIVLELHRRVRGVRAGELEDAAISTAVLGSASAALALLFLALRPVVCM